MQRYTIDMEDPRQVRSYGLKPEFYPSNPGKIKTIEKKEDQRPPVGLYNEVDSQRST